MNTIRVDSVDGWEVTACKKLMWAVLTTAIQDCAAPYDRRHFKISVRPWFLNTDMEYPFSFLSICEALSLDPKRIRNYVFNSQRNRVRNYRKRCVAA